MIWEFELFPKLASAILARRSFLLGDRKGDGREGRKHSDLIVWPTRLWWRDAYECPLGFSLKNQGEGGLKRVLLITWGLLVPQTTWRSGGEIVPGRGAIQEAGGGVFRGASPVEKRTANRTKQEALAHRRGKWEGELPGRKIPCDWSGFYSLWLGKEHLDESPY